MECQECHQRPATVHFTQVINGNKTEVHLCEPCAQEKGYMMDQYGGDFSIGNLLSGLFNFESSPLTSGHSTTFTPNSGLKCEKCGMTYDEFKRTGKFGCAHCYQTFDAQIDPILRRVHSGNTRHNGKIPERMGGNLHIQRELERYRGELQDLIQREEFEKAAKIRDKIRSLENELNRKKDGEE
ncbi:protein arginine kinase activator [Melghiribacillus thermohalophilus]|uniref:Protein arginine kinase activator n=1 Tax=Melghiribacillus thermohalophilus TaxID=1324956 RepID=A0A4R3MZK1_9BACI|nr:UvrB/UvrC motif-containing protein [Melghiribacillus thermohalophilus]TCT21046.1 protein arginine kinase activator [Melghiribacillus thermohalophilus]